MSEGLCEKVKADAYLGVRLPDCLLREVERAAFETRSKKSRVVVDVLTAHFFPTGATKEEENHG